MVTKKQSGQMVLGYHSRNEARNCVVLFNISDLQYTKCVQKYDCLHSGRLK